MSQSHDTIDTLNVSEATHKEARLISRMKLIRAICRLTDAFCHIESRLVFQPRPPMPVIERMDQLVERYNSLPLPEGKPVDLDTPDAIRNLVYYHTKLIREAQREDRQIRLVMAQAQLAILNTQALNHLTDTVVSTDREEEMIVSKLVFNVLALVHSTMLNIWGYRYETPPKRTTPK